MLSVSLSPLKNVPSYLYILKKKVLYSSFSFLFYGGTITTLLLSVEPFKLKLRSLLPYLSFYQKPYLSYPPTLSLSSEIPFSSSPSHQYTKLLRRNLLFIDSSETHESLVPTIHKTAEENVFSLPSPLFFSKILPIPNTISPLIFIPRNTTKTSLGNTSLTETFMLPAVTPLIVTEEIDLFLPLSSLFSQRFPTEEVFSLPSAALNLPFNISRTASLEEFSFSLRDLSLSSYQDTLLPPSSSEMPKIQIRKSLDELYSETLLHMKMKHPSLFARIAYRRFTLAFYFLAELLKIDSSAFQDDVCKCEKFILTLPDLLSREMEKDEILKNFKKSSQDPDLFYSLDKVGAALAFLQSKRLIRSSESERIVEDELDPKYDKKYKYTILRRSSWNDEEMADF